jgi:hypothetical protein
MCGKKFVPAPYHIYHMPHSKESLVCTYKCMREAELQEAAKKNK